MAVLIDASTLVDLATARAHAQVWTTLAAAGTLIGPHDLWLAATCIAYGLTMVTGVPNRGTRRSVMS